MSIQMIKQNIDASNSQTFATDLFFRIRIN